MLGSESKQETETAADEQLAIDRNLQSDECHRFDLVSDNQRRIEADLLDLLPGECLLSFDFANQYNDSGEKVAYLMLLAINETYLRTISSCPMC